MIEQRVKAIVLDILSVVAPDADVSSLHDEANLRDHLDLDSMDFLDIVMELRKRFKVEVPKEEYPQLATLAGCVTYLAPKLQAVSAV